MINKFKNDYNRITNECQIFILQDGNLHPIITLPSWLKEDKKLATELTRILNEYGEHIKISF